MIENLDNYSTNILKRIIEGKKIKEFSSGQDYIPVTGKLLDENDILFGIDSMLDQWLTSGRYTTQFEKNFTEYIGAKKALLVNSGSSANLLAFYTLTTEILKSRKIIPGDEIITVAAGFPTTVNPIIQAGCIPVFVDIELGTYNINSEKIEEAITDRTKGIMLAHTLGNPFNLTKVKSICKSYNLWLVEDNCDALGATYQDKKTGSFGDLATSSFYPAHHITMGEGGALSINNRKLISSALSLRDWGRDCYCDTGCDNTCGKRFNWKFENLPFGFDHKYVYTNIGFNLKVTDIQAAIGYSQLKKVDDFVAKRRTNHSLLKNLFLEMSDFFILPEETKKSSASWFGFALTIKNPKIKRNELINYLENSKIGTRLLFGGNLTKQPAYKKVKYRISGELKNTDIVLENTFWVGVWPGISESNINYIYDTFKTFLKTKSLI